MNETYISIFSLIISIVMLFIAIWTLKQSNKIQGQNIFHDLVKMERVIYEDLGNIGGQIGIQRAINFYEYLSFLYLNKIIDNKMTERLFKHELIRNYEKFERHIKPGFNNLQRLYKMFKENKNDIHH